MTHCNIELERAYGTWYMCYVIYVFTQISLNDVRDEMQVIFSRVLSHNLNLDFCSTLHAFRTEEDSSGDVLFVFDELSDKFLSIITPKGFNIFINEVIRHKN